MLYSDYLFERDTIVKTQLMNSIFHRNNYISLTNIDTLIIVSSAFSTCAFNIETQGFIYTVDNLFYRCSFKDRLQIKNLSEHNFFYQCIIRGNKGREFSNIELSIAEKDSIEVLRRDPSNFNWTEFQIKLKKKPKKTLGL